MNEGRENDWKIQRGMNHSYSKNGKKADIIKGLNYWTITMNRIT